MATVYYICGPTAGGKTSFSIAPAQRLPQAVLINADTMQLYRGLEPLAMHPSPEEQKLVEHRLFGVLDLSQDMSRAAWLDLAKQEIERAFAQGKQPILIGGSRSFAAELMRAAQGLEIKADLDNAITFPASQGPRPDFPHQLHTIMLMSPVQGREAAFRKLVERKAGPALESLVQARHEGHFYDPARPGFWVFGAKEYSAVLDGALDLRAAQDIIVKKALDYAAGQDGLLAGLEQRLRGLGAKVLLLHSEDGAQNVDKALAFMGAGPARGFAAPKPRPGI
jgi:hypothetical protein